MGIPTGFFKEEEVARQQLVCAVCLELVVDPVFASLSCQHSFCRRCLEEWTAASRGRECPQCRVKMDKRFVQNMEARRRLFGLQARCPECGESGAHSDPDGEFVQRHLRNCKERGFAEEYHEEKKEDGKDQDKETSRQRIEEVAGENTQQMQADNPVVSGLVSVAATVVIGTAIVVLGKQFARFIKRK